MQTSLLSIPPPSQEDATRYLDEAKRIAAAGLVVLVEDLTRRATVDAATVKTKLDVAEHFYKVSGMAAKQGPQGAGTGFKINIILGGGNSRSHTVTLEAEPEFSLPERDTSRVPLFLVSNDAELEN